MAKPSDTYDQVISANTDYVANFGDKGKLALPPARRFAILTCMDARPIPQNMPASPRAMLTSSAMPADGPPMTPSARW